MKPFLSLLTLLALWTSPLLAQEGRMDQDLRMMRQVAEELFRTGNPDAETYRVSTRPLKAVYTPGFGILLHTPVFVGQRSGGSYTYIMEGNGMVIRQQQQPKPEEVEEDRSELETAVEDLLRYFLAEYGDLAGELTDQEHILLVYEQEDRGLAFNIGGTSWNHHVEEPSRMRLTARVQMRDVRAFRAGSLSESGFEQAIEVVKGTGDARAELPYRVLGKVLTEVYEPSAPESAQFHRQEQGQVMVFHARPQRPNMAYEVLPGYGVTYTLKFDQMGGFPRVITTQPALAPRADRQLQGRVITEDIGIQAPSGDAQVQALYATTTGALKQALIEYGRTLRDLGSEAWLSVQVQLPGCDSCTAPAEVHLRVQGKTLEAFDRRQIDLNQALRAVTVTETGLAREQQARPRGIFVNPDVEIHFGDGYEEDEDEDEDEEDER